MSRMMIAVCLWSILSSGCQCFDYLKYHYSLTTARVESLCPSIRCGTGRCQTGRFQGGSSCIPHRPFTPGYDAEYDYYVTQHTAQRCAFHDIRDYRVQSRGPMSHHFKRGFINAYEDLALNRQPAPPNVPPPVYWNAYYRSPAGQGFVDDWFAGYEAGREMGLNSGVSQFHEVYLSRFNNGCGPVVPASYAPRSVNAYGQPQPTWVTPQPAVSAPVYGPAPVNASGQQQPTSVTPPSAMTAPTNTMGPVGQ